MPYPVVNLTNMSGTKIDSLLQSVQLSVEVPNGSFVALGAELANRHNVRIASTPTDVANQEVLLVASPEIIEINGLRLELQDPTLFVNPKDRPARAYHLKVADTFVITADGIDGTPTVGQYVIPQNGNFKGVPSATIGSTKVSLQVLSETKITVGRNRMNAYKLQVVKEA